MPQEEINKMLEELEITKKEILKEMEENHKIPLVIEENMRLNHQNNSNNGRTGEVVIGRLAVRYAAKYLRSNWTSIAARVAPKFAKYLGKNTAFKVLDYLEDKCDTVDNLCWCLWRELLPSFVPDSVVGGIKNATLFLI